MNQWLLGPRGEFEHDYKEVTDGLYVNWGGYSTYTFIKTYLLNSTLKFFSTLLDVHYSSK